MSVIAVVVVVVVAIFAASMLGAWLRGGGPQSEIKGVREEMQRLMTAQAQGFSAQMGQVTQIVTQQLSEVRRELETGVTTAGQITAEAQKDMSVQLRESTTVLSRLTEHLGAMQQSGRELTQAAQTMQAVLGGPKSRGVLGETQLENLLSDMLPQNGYDLEYQFSNGATATAVLHAGRKLVAIDAEFPLEACREIVEKGEQAREQFAQAVREQVDAIAEAFIVPAEGTLDLALMFVPSESAFVELLLTADEDGRLDDYCRQKHVLPVSPNSLHAYLGAVLVGLKGMEFEENAKRMLSSLDGIKDQFTEFAQIHAQLGTQIDQASKTYAQSGQQLDRARTALDTAVPAGSSEQVAASPAMASHSPSKNGS